MRKKVRGTEQRPRLCVFKSARHIYAQLIDDLSQRTIATATTLSKEIKLGGGKGNKEAAKAIGTLIAKKSLDKGIEKVVFDRNGFLYHGRVKALADAAREEGLKF